MNNMEPIHDMTARNTASSGREGRMKVDVGGMRNRKRRILKDKTKKLINNMK